MSRVHLWLIPLMVLLFVVPVQASEVADYSKTIRIFKESEVTNKFFSHSYGYAVFPLVGKAGIGIGGSFGQGQVYRGGKVTGKVSLAKLSIGFQLGGQAFSEMIFFEDKRAYDEFTSGSFELDATASAVAITAGAQASAGSTGASAGVSSGPSTGEQLGATYVKGLAIFVHAKGGLMYEAAIGGQAFIFEPLGRSK